MSGTYMLQATRARFNQHQVDPTCLLFRKNPENVERFLLRCETLTQVRNPFLEKNLSIITKVCGSGSFQQN